MNIREPLPERWNIQFHDEKGVRLRILEGLKVVKGIIDRGVS